MSQSPEDVARSIRLSQQLLRQLRQVGAEPDARRRVIEQHLGEVRVELERENLTPEVIDRFIRAHRQDAERLMSPDLPSKWVAVNTTPVENSLVADRYLLGSPMPGGRGGFGQVYEATDTTDGTKVALKLISAEDAPPDWSIRLNCLAEMDRHPNLVGIRAHGVLAGGEHYLVMDLVSGGTLAQYLKECASARPPLDLVLRWGRQLAGGMAFFHTETKGAVHRDLKPKNVLLTTGEAATAALKVIDLDGAQPPDPGRGKQTIHGTPWYRSPEQAGNGWPVTPAVDVHALGVILYELLTGRTPFVNADTDQAAQKNAAAKQPRMRRKPRATNPDLAVLGHLPAPPEKAAKPGWLPSDPADRQRFNEIAVVCLTCMRKIPPNRYPSAADVADDLARIQIGKQPIGRPLGPVGLMRELIARRPEVGKAAAIAPAVLLMIGLIAWTWFGRSPETARPDPGLGYKGEVDAAKQQWQATIEPADFADMTTLVPEDVFERLNGFVDRCERLNAAHPDDHEMATLLGRARLKQTAALVRKIQLEKATTAAERARDLFAAVVESTPELHDELAQSWRAITVLRLARNVPDAAAAREAVAHRSRAVSGQPHRPTAALSLFHDRLLLAAVLRALKQDDEAAKALDLAVAELDRAREVPDRALYHRTLSDGFAFLGCDNDWRNRPDEADRYYRRSLDENVLGYQKVLVDAIATYPIGQLAAAWSPVDDVVRLIPINPLGSGSSNIYTSRTTFYRHRLDAGANPGLIRAFALSLFYESLAAKTDSDSATRRRAAFIEFDSHAQELAAKAVDAEWLCDLAESYIILAVFDRSDRAFNDWLQRASVILGSSALRGQKGHTGGRIRLVRTVACMCKVLDVSREAVRDQNMDKCLVGVGALNEAAVSGQWAAPFIQVYYPMFEVVVTKRLQFFLESGQTSEARRLAERMTIAITPGPLPVAGELLYNMACAYAQSAVTERTPESKDRLEREAIGTLRRAFTAGFGRPFCHNNANIRAETIPEVNLGEPRYKNPFGSLTPLDHMHKDTDLASIRKREDYKQLDAELQQFERK